MGSSPVVPFGLASEVKVFYAGSFHSRKLSNQRHELIQEILINCQ